jgi:hypothetical protein
VREEMENEPEEAGAIQSIHAGGNRKQKEN